MKIFVDLDEVLADFVGGVASLWDIPQSRLLAHWPAGAWDCVPPLRAAAGEPGLTEDAFWRRIEAAGEGFWAGLRPLPWWRDVLRLVRAAAGDDWRVLSAPSRDPACHAGKVRWAARRLGGTGRLLMVPARDKPLLAGRGRLLIDDREETVVAWAAAGGTGVLFPRHHNKAWRHAADPAGYLRGVFAAAGYTRGFPPPPAPASSRTEELPSCTS